MKTNKLYHADEVAEMPYTKADAEQDRLDFAEASRRAAKGDRAPKLTWTKDIQFKAPTPAELAAEQAEREEAKKRAYATGNKALRMLTSPECNPWLKPEDSGRLFNRAKGKFIGIYGSTEHEIHIAHTQYVSARGAERKERHDYLNALLFDYPKEALRYYRERADILGENWRQCIAGLQVRVSLAKGSANV